MRDGNPPERRAATVFRLLTQGQFALFFTFNGLSLIGSWMQRIASAWLIWEWTGSAFWVGVLAACDLLPVVLTGPFAGVAADRWDRLWQNRIAQIASAILALINAVLLMAGMLGLYGLLTLIALQGTLIAMVQPARLAMVPQLVAREDMPTAVALASVNVNLARLIGPAVAGAMILRFPIEWIFIANFVVTALFVVALGRIRLAPRAESAGQGGIWQQMAEGFSYVARMPTVRLIMLFMLVGGMMVRAIQELTPALAAQTFAVSATGLAVLSSATAAGAVISGLTMARTGARRLFLGVIGFWTVGAISALVLAWTRHPLVASVAAAALGFSVSRSLISTQTFVQLETPDELRGRALSTHGLIARASPALGALIIGYLADRLGLAIGVAAASITMLVFAAILFPYARSVADRTL